MPNNTLTSGEEATLRDEDITLDEYGNDFKPVNSIIIPEGNPEFTRRLSRIERRQYKAVVGTVGEPFAAAVLCNLSKREYLRQETVDGFGYASFGTFLLSRFCWSNNGSVGMNYRNLSWELDR
ncbi:hypothetical protein FRB95_003453 [Tulasnella sp. JGI-2019a]|nr:hypothetical protein FRB95_003453 [Tulasnella sp. JGI-2019a]